MDEQPHGRHSAAITALVIVSIVALGVVVGGLLQPADEPELTVAPTTTAPPSATTPEQEYVYVTPEVDPDADIPGCDTVESPEDSSAEFTGSYSMLGGADYANPNVPWYDGPKAHLMSQAVLERLPADTTFADGVAPYFEPIPVTADSQGTPIDSANAVAQLSIGQLSAFFSVAVFAADSAEPPPCVAGQLDERTTRADGTVVDIDDSWSELNGERTSTRTASAYHPDSSVVSVYLSADGGESRVPLSTDDLADMVADPSMRTSAPVPAGTPGNVTGCSPDFVDGQPVPFTRIETRALNAVLLDANSSVLAPSPPLGALHTSQYGTGLCQAVDSAFGRLTVTVVRGGEEPEESETGDPVTAGSQSEGSEAVAITPSGLRVSVRTALPVPDPVVLETLADAFA